MIKLEQVSGELAEVAGIAGDMSTLAIGIDTALSNSLNAASNVAAVTANSILGRSVFVNKNNELTLTAPLKTINAILSMAPDIILGTTIVVLKKAISITKCVATFLDMAMNYKKLAFFENVSESLKNILKECAIALVNVAIFSIIVPRLVGTRFRILVGPLVLFWINVGYAKMATDGRYDFLRAFAEEVFSLAELPIVICRAFSKIS
jgi:hypothetical protein